MDFLYFRLFMVVSLSQRMLRERFDSKPAGSPHFYKQQNINILCPLLIKESGGRAGGISRRVLRKICFVWEVSRLTNIGQAMIRLLFVKPNPQDLINNHINYWLIPIFMVFQVEIVNLFAFINHVISEGKIYCSDM